MSSFVEKIVTENKFTLFVLKIVIILGEIEVKQWINYIIRKSLYRWQSSSVLKIQHQQDPVHVVEIEKLGVISSEEIAVHSVNCSLCERQVDCICSVFCNIIKVAFTQGQLWPLAQAMWRIIFRFEVSWKELSWREKHLVLVLIKNIFTEKYQQKKKLIGNSSTRT